MAAAADRDWFYGPTGGYKLLDADCCETGNPLNVGLVAGMRFPNRLGVEVQITDTVAKGEFLDRDMEIMTAAAFATYRSGGDTYYKMKFGAVKGEINVEGVDMDGDGVAYGVGIGISIGSRHKMEIEYTVEDFVDAGSLSYLGVAYLF